MAHIVLYRDFDGSELAVDEPFTENVPFSQFVSGLAIPSFVDTSNQAVKMGIAAIWASRNSLQLFEAERKKLKLRGYEILLAFGSLAIKLLCPSSNEINSPFNRSIGDLDFVAGFREAPGLVNLLSQLHTKLGTQYFFFLTPQDKSFNALRGGRRYRVRMLSGVDDGKPVVKDVDIFCGDIELRHRLVLDTEFSQASINNWTIGPTKLLLSKIQGIMEISESELGLLKESNQTFRMLDYPYYKPGRLIIGLEWKDMLDTCSLLHDCCNSSESRFNIDLSQLRVLLSKDKKFALTARLNIMNIISNEDFLKSKGLSSTAVSRIVQNAQVVLDAVPVVNKKWSRPWWNDDVETPIIT